MQRLEVPAAWFVNIYPNRIVVYYQYIEKIKKSYIPKFDDKQFQRKRSLNSLSNVSISKIKKSINYLLFVSKYKTAYSYKRKKKFKFKISFITLTLCAKQIHSDNYIKSYLLNHFLITAKRKWNVKNYIWKAERQKNGNIHFHILTDAYIPYQELKDTWNNIQEKYNYVTRYRDKMKKFYRKGFKLNMKYIKNWSAKEQYKAYLKNKATDWNSPNSTDIHSVYKIKNVSAYIIKYMCKDETNKPITGRVWGCNFALSNMKPFNDICNNDYVNLIDYIKQKYNVNTFEGDYFSIIYLDLNNEMLAKDFELYDNIKNYFINQNNELLKLEKT